MPAALRTNTIEAEAALAAGQLNRAATLIQVSESQHLEVRRLVSELVDRLLDRASQSAETGKLSEAWQDLALVVEFCGETQRVQQLRKRLLDSIDQTLAKALAQGDLDRFEMLLSELLRKSPSDPRWQSYQHLIGHVRVSERMAQVGRFAEAIVAMHEAAKSKPDWEAASQRIRRLEDAHEKTRELLLGLHRATENKRWQEVIDKANAILAIAPRHPLAIQIRNQAFTEINQPPPRVPKDAAMVVDSKHRMIQPKPAIGANGTPENQVANVPAEKPGNPAKARGGIFGWFADPEQKNAEPKSAGGNSPTDELPHQNILWIDGVGGYLLCDQIELVIGQAIPGNKVDLAIVGDLSRRAVVIRRSGEDHLLQPLQEVYIQGQKVDRATPLRDGDIISLGTRVQIRYSRPNPLSSTARLDLVSRHRWQPHVDGVLLMADSCVLGPNPGSHVFCPFWSEELVLFQHQGKLYCRGDQTMEVNGKSVKGQFVLQPGHRIQGTDFSFGLE